MSFVLKGDFLNHGETDLGSLDSALQYHADQGQTHTRRGKMYMANLSLPIWFQNALDCKVVSNCELNSSRVHQRFLIPYDFMGSGCLH